MKTITIPLERYVKLLHKEVDLELVNEFVEICNFPEDTLEELQAEHKKIEAQYPDVKVNW